MWEVGNCLLSMFQVGNALERHWHIPLELIELLRCAEDGH